MTRRVTRPLVRNSQEQKATLTAISLGSHTVSGSADIVKDLNPVSTGFFRPLGWQRILVLRGTRTEETIKFIEVMVINCLHFFLVTGQARNGESQRSHRHRDRFYLWPADGTFGKERAHYTLQLSRRDV